MTTISGDTVVTYRFTYLCIDVFIYLFFMCFLMFLID